MMAGFTGGGVAPDGAVTGGVEADGATGRSSFRGFGCPESAGTEESGTCFGMTTGLAGGAGAGAGAAFGRMPGGFTAGAAAGAAEGAGAATGGFGGAGAPMILDSRCRASTRRASIAFRSRNCFATSGLTASHPRSAPAPSLNFTALGFACGAAC